ncbi:MAG TPA: DUF3048 domain-containing protein [Candidatus Angelobacter sp.]|nr:DUF3048 domain-containing protein [Candidatus Angelobacter sp.]
MRPRRHHPRPVAIAGLGALALALGACAAPAGSGPTGTPSGSSSTSASATVSPTASATPGIPDGASPLSGRPGGAGRPVLVVKFDNTPNAQPHAGLTAADIVYVEEVEFGLTRLAAVFSSSLPRIVGPIRSARISDIDLLAQYGHPAFAYSGSQHRLRPVIAAAPLYDVSGDKGPAGYFRDGHRPAPYNFFGIPAQLLARAPRASVAQDIGFEFSATVPIGGRPVKSATVPYPSSQAAFVWNAKLQSWDVRLNKRPARAVEGGTQHASTVVIQYVRQHDSGYGDKFGGRTPKEETIGTGKAWVLRNGRGYPVTWSRPSATQGTTFTGADGQVVPFAAGQIWVVLVNSATKAVIA